MPWPPGPIAQSSRACTTAIRLGRPALQPSSRGHMHQQPSSRSNTIKCTDMHRPVNRSPTAAEGATKTHRHASPIQQPLSR
eukprot:3326169-Alexandrium_andersonii.AAC.1